MIHVIECTFNYMDHLKHYNKLIERAKTRHLTGYVERHHILPRALGGSDDASNIVELTAREHFIAHQLLARIYGGKMWYALWMMSNSKRYGSKQYAWIAEGWSNTQKGKKLSDETRRKMSESRKGRKPSEATIRAAAKANSALVRTEQHRAGLAKAKSIPIIQYDLYNHIVAEFSSSKEAGRVTGLSSLQINRATRGKTKNQHYAGFIWRKK